MDPLLMLSCYISQEEPYSNKSADQEQRITQRTPSPVVEIENSDESDKKNQLNLLKSSMEQKQKMINSYFANLILTPPKGEGWNIGKEEEIEEALAKAWAIQSDNKLKALLKVVLKNSSLFYAPSGINYIAINLVNLNQYNIRKISARKENLAATLISPEYNQTNGGKVPKEIGWLIKQIKDCCFKQLYALYRPQGRPEYYTSRTINARIILYAIGDLKTIEMNPNNQRKEKPELDCDLDGLDRNEQASSITYNSFQKKNISEVKAILDSLIEISPIIPPTGWITEKKERVHSILNIQNRKTSVECSLRKLSKGIALFKAPSGKRYALINFNEITNKRKTSKSENENLKKEFTRIKLFSKKSNVSKEIQKEIAWFTLLLNKYYFKPICEFYENKGVKNPQKATFESLKGRFSLYLEEENEAQEIAMKEINTGEEYSSGTETFSSEEDLDDTMDLGD